MRVLLLRRLRVHLPLVPRCCLCRLFLDPFGDHRCACSTSGYLSLRGYDLEVAMARVCREAGARVQPTNFFVILMLMVFHQRTAEESRLSQMV